MNSTEQAAGQPDRPALALRVQQVDDLGQPLDKLPDLLDGAQGAEDGSGDVRGLDHQAAGRVRNAV